MEQLDDSLSALVNIGFTAEELAEIDRHATEGDVNVWRASSIATAPVAR